MNTVNPKLDESTPESTAKRRRLSLKLQKEEIPKQWQKEEIPKQRFVFASAEEISEAK